MNFEVIRDIRSGIITKGEQESGQEFMERILKAVCTPETGNVPDFDDKMSPELFACDYENMTLTYKFDPKDWMMNPHGTIHGGIITTACDMTMGSLVRFCAGRPDAVTVQINIEFIRPVMTGEPYTVEAHIVKKGKTVIFCECKARDLGTGNVLAAATGTFM